MITEKIWGAIASIAIRPFVRIAIIRQAKKRPYTHIGGYMERYWIVPESWNLPFAVRVHWIKRPDADLYVHDHPWNWRTIILQGYYIEEDAFGVFRRRTAGDTVGASAETFHRIADICPGGVWTVFITGRRRNDWGFMVPRPSGLGGSFPRKIHWKEYKSPNGRAA